jgi:tetratricopeptide (TPR) repeat protein
VAAVFCFAATFDWHWESSALVVLGLGGAAVAAGAAAVRVRPGSRLAPRRLALIALAVIAGAVQVPGIVAANRSQAAEAAFAAGLRDHAVELAGDAVQAEPWAAEPRALRGYLLLAQDDTAAARDDALDAVHLEPTNWRHRLLLARVEVAAGDYAAARAALEQLARLRPGAAVDPGAALRAMRSAGG